jgi:histone H3/H4
MSELVIRSKIKNVAKDYSVAGDVADALDKMADELMRQAIKRADANGRKTIQPKDVFVGRIGAETMLVVKSRVKDVAENYNVAGDFANALNEMLVWHISQGCERARANGRRTLQAKDL